MSNAIFIILGTNTNVENTNCIIAFLYYIFAAISYIYVENLNAVVDFQYDFNKLP